MTSVAFSFLLPLARALVALALWPLAVLAQAPAWESGTDGLAPIPRLSARVTDVTGTLNAAERQALEAKLAAFEQQTGGQFAVLMVPSTAPEPIEAYSIRVADAWKIGRKGQDNGVLLLVAKDDRKLRLEVGYGYEGVLTDAMSKRIIAETIAPFFRQGQFAAGINAGVDRAIAVIGRDPSAVAPAAGAKPPPGSIGRGIDLGSLLVFLLVIVPVMGSILRRIFGKVGGATVGAGLVGTGAAVVAGSIFIGIAAALIAWVVLIFVGSGAGLRGQRPSRRIVRTVDRRWLGRRWRRDSAVAAGSEAAVADSAGAVPPAAGERGDELKRCPGLPRTDSGVTPSPTRRTSAAPSRPTGWRASSARSAKARPRIAARCALPSSRRSRSPASCASCLRESARWRSSGNCACGTPRRTTAY